MLDAPVERWVFDLDNTLYPPELRLFDQIDRRMTAFIAETLRLSEEAADALRYRYWREHGTTLRGLMIEHDLAPAPFLAAAHDIDLAGVRENPALSAAIAALPGRKIVHTNGARAHAERVLARLGISALFDGVYGVEDAALTPKPDRRAYERVLALAAMAPEGAAMIEDTARNLIAPKAMGMVTIWTPHDCEIAQDGAEGGHIDHIAEDLAAFLEACPRRAEI